MQYLFLSLLTDLSNFMIFITKTLAQIKSQEFICHMKHPLTYFKGIKDFDKCGIKGCVHLSLQPNNMLFGGLQPIIVPII